MICNSKYKGPTPNPSKEGNLVVRSIIIFFDFLFTSNVSKNVQILFSAIPLLGGAKGGLFPHPSTTYFILLHKFHLSDSPPWRGKGWVISPPWWVIPYFSKSNPRWFATHYPHSVLLPYRQT